MADRTDVITKVQKLIALTDSPYEEEARTAALTAVRLIKANNLLREEGLSLSEVRLSAMTRMVRVAFDSLVFDLTRTARSAVYPYITVKGVSEKFIEDFAIKAEFRDLLTAQVKQELKRRVVIGELESKPGKGYRLKYSMVCDIGA